MAASNAPLCCGAFSLLVGVELICLVNLLVAVFVIATVSSVVPVTVGNIIIAPNMQMIVAAWAAAGIPLVVGAGVGIVYRIEVFLRTYFWYLAATIAIEGVFFIKFLISGSVCSTFAPKDLERLGTTFVCGMTDTFALFWGLIVIGISSYFLYIIWAAQTDIKKGYWPELMKYRDAWSVAADGIPFVPQPVVGSQLPGPSSFKLPGSGIVGGPPGGLPLNSVPNMSVLGSVAQASSITRPFPQPAYGSVPGRTRSVSPPVSPRMASYSTPAMLGAGIPTMTSTAPRSPRGAGFIPSPGSWTPVTSSSRII